MIQGVVFSQLQEEMQCFVWSIGSTAILVVDETDEVG